MFEPKFDRHARHETHFLSLKAHFYASLNLVIQGNELFLSSMEKRWLGEFVLETIYLGKTSY